MALLHSLPIAAILLLIGFLHIAGVQSIGVCYGTNGNNLPSVADTINLYKQNGIGGLRIYDATTDVFDVLRGSNIDVIVDVPNDKLQDLANPDTANDWVQRNIVPYPDVNFKYVAVGNEVYPGNTGTDYALTALQNVHAALSAANKGGIKASTATFSFVLDNTYPPNNGVFKDEAKSLMEPIVQFLAQNNLPLLANIYPYFGRNSAPLSFSLFSDTPQNPVGYQNMFDAMLDSMYAAVEKAGGSNVQIVVSESGWPSDGGQDASPENAATYYQNLIQHVKGNPGTPMKPGIAIETYLFAMFDENEKNGDATEQHFGLFSPDQSPKYQLSFN
ncbi:PREDICTED: glucan endo-1,3-beta-glucosidase, acidic-like [Ipomoea nil]|uniref:glucan endo-1,3-beta-glucosidase, acidic-like n=1 Tax=Ipomoea nil TaxID=35883 RepID=UPI0009013F7B|nr:PREDICTED: glucan endo-1,3-beta-glucosidase, acidic-like [Ipomoea nil]